MSFHYLMKQIDIQSKCRIFYIPHLSGFKVMQTTSEDARIFLMGGTPAQWWGSQ